MMKRLTLALMALVALAMPAFFGGIQNIGAAYAQTPTGNPTFSSVSSGGKRALCTFIRNTNVCDPTGISIDTTSGAASLNLAVAPIRDAAGNALITTSGAQALAIAANVDIGLGASHGVIREHPVDVFGTFGGNLTQHESSFNIQSSTVDPSSPVTSAYRSTITVTTGTRANAWPGVFTAAVTSTTPMPSGVLTSGQHVGVTGQGIRYNFAAGGSSVNPEIWASVFTDSDLTGQPSNLSGGGPAVEIDYKADGADPGLLRGNLVLAAVRGGFAAGPAVFGNMLSITLGDAPGGFGQANLYTERFIELAGAFHTAAIDLRDTVQMSGASAIRLGDNNNIAFDSAGGVTLHYNPSTLRLEFSVNNGIIGWLDTAGDLLVNGNIQGATWTGITIGADHGGTGQSSYTIGDLLYASGATALSKLADVAAGNVLRAGGVGAAPAYGKINLSSDLDANTLPAANSAALAGDVTKTAGANNTVLATAQPAVHTWALAQTFTVAPVFSALTGYIKGNGASAATAAATVPTSDLSGTLAAAQEPAHTGDVTNSAGSLALTLATTQAAIHTWSLAQTFTVAPVFSALTGYIKGNGASASTAAATVPTSDLSGTLAAAQEPAHTGDVTNTAGSLALALATAQGAVHTWALAQTFTVAPIFTDQSGTRTALGLGTAAIVNTGTSGATIPLLNGTNTFSGTNTFNAAVAGWSSANFGKQLVVSISSAVANPNIGFFDVNNTNGIAAMSNGSSGFALFAMPALSDNTTAVVNMLTVGRTGLITGYNATLIASGTALTNGGGGGSSPTLGTNGPTGATTPTKWVQISDNGTTRNIPTW